MSATIRQGLPVDYFLALRLFVRVVKLESFSRTAESYELRTSSVSRSIAALEKDLGVTLLRRSTRHVQLTSAGAAFYDRATALLASLDEARSFAGSLAEQPTGVLVVRSPIEFGRRHIIPVLDTYLAANPGVKIQLAMGLESRDDFSMESDLTIHTGELRDSRYFARQIATNRDFIVCAPSYMQGREPVKHPIDLVRHSCQVLTRESEWRFRSPGTTIEDHVAVAGSLESSDREALLHAALAGLGIARLPGWLVAEDVQAGRLEILLRDFDPTPVDSAIYALCPERMSTLPKVASFVAAIEARIGKPAPWDLL